VNVCVMCMLLLLAGATAQGQSDNTTAPAVHLWFDAPDGKGMEYFYQEVTVPTGCDPLYTYFMVIGWNRTGDGYGAGGYCGLQTTGDAHGGRPLLYSVWNTEDRPNSDTAYWATVYKAGEEAIVQDYRFDHEGSGVTTWNENIQWQNDTTYCFLVHFYPSCQTEGSTDTATDTTFFGLYWKKKSEAQWHLQAIVVSPHNGIAPAGTYAFIEDWSEETGDALRQARYANQWLKPLGGGWQEALTATATSGSATGRTDRDARADGNGYVIRAGGRTPGNVPDYLPLTREPSGGPCPVTADDEAYFYNTLGREMPRDTAVHNEHIADATPLALIPAGEDTYYLEGLAAGKEFAIYDLRGALVLKADKQPVRLVARGVFVVAQGGRYYKFVR